MEKLNLRHLTIKGFARGEELSKCERLERKLHIAQNKFTTAQKEVIHAKEKLSQAIEESLQKLKAKEKENRRHEGVDPEKADAYEFGFDDIKLKYNKTIIEIEAKKNEIQKKLVEYKADGTEKWDSFKHKLNHDLDELGKALKRFTTPTK